jgi:predicted CXXCH cytochrome family protein
MRKNWFIAAAAAVLAACGGDDDKKTQQPPVEQPEIALEANGVVGAVSDASAARVSGGAVYFVPAADVAALPMTTIAGKTGPEVAGATDDEPLEDLVAANAASYAKAEVDSKGVYRLATLPQGSYFVTFVPAEGAALLPGGSECRKAKASAELVGKRLDVSVSAATPADATFVGTGKCAGCHADQLTSEKFTMHRLGIWSPYHQGPMQDFGDRAAELMAAFTQKFEARGGAGTTIYFHSYDGTRAMDKYKTSETDPGANVSFTARVFKDGDKYKVELKNVKTPGDGDAVYTVDVVYGGGVKKQRYMTKMTAPGGGFFYAILPFQYQPDGVETYGRTSTVWRDYNSGTKWYDETNGKFRVYAVKDSFEKNCVSCHATGAVVTGSDTTNWTAQVIRDAQYGDFDYGDMGTPAEMNLGCENCHGPGSAHVAAGGGAGKFIVTPDLLTPEREAMLCGQCHSRPKGTLNTDSPVNAAGKMITAGTSRQVFLAEYATSQADGAAGDYYADEDRHSKSHHQQYSDFVRSGMYKNASELMTCASCHDPHGRPNARQLRADPTSNAALCGSCHQAQATDLAGHLTAKAIPMAAGKASFARCTDCHMPKAAKTGAGEPGIAITVDGVTTQYWMNDVTSHLFAVPDRSNATTQSMPVPYTNACGSCHVTKAP